MARDARIEHRLQRWAQWITIGDGSGYAARSVLHPEWSPPTKGSTPTLKVGAASDVRETHRAVGRLSMRQANTVVVHYVLRLPIGEQAVRLECAAATVFARIDDGHRRLAALLYAADQQEEFCNIESDG